LTALRDNKNQSLLLHPSLALALLGYE